jgi:hypothetical protein
MGEIFLSYSRRDQEFADALTRGLQMHSLQVWVDRHDIEAGEAWRAAISHAIDECDAFLVVLSPQCVTSKNVVKELSIAESRDRHIIPLMYQNCEIPPAMEYQLSGLQQIEFCGVAFEAALERVVQTLQRGRTPVGPTPEINASARALLAPRTPQPAIPSCDATPSSPQAGAAFQQAQAPQAAFAPQDLAQILCGRWNVQIGSAYVGVAQAMVDMYPNGGFQGRIVGPTGLIAVTGLWR